MTKAFNIRIPAQAYNHPEALLTWINSHVNPGVPVQRTIFTVRDLEAIYTKFKSKLERCLSLEVINAYRKSKAIPPMFAQEHAAWKHEQEVELQFSPITDGRFMAKFLLSGPSHTGDNGTLGMGYVDLTQFELGLWYSPDGDMYTLTYMDKEAGHSVQIPDDVVPLKLFPVFEFNYQQDAKNPETNLSTEDLFAEFLQKFSKTFWDDKVANQIRNAISITDISVELDPRDPSPQKTLEKIVDLTSQTRTQYFPWGLNTPADKGYFGFEEVSKAAHVLETQMLAADALAGGFFKPLMLSVFSIEVPVKEGTCVYTKATFSYGQRMTVMIPPLVLREEEPGVYTYL